MIRIQREDFSLDEVAAELDWTGSGALVSFTGKVRAHSRDGAQVRFVEWDVYQSMAVRILEQIRREAIERFGLINAAVVHRYGRQQPGENLVLILTASAHRKEAFRACEFIMDEIKKRAPLWKKEILADGRQRWIEG